jgi:hypothetical protein
MHWLECRRSWIQSLVGQTEDNKITMHWPVGTIVVQIYWSHEIATGPKITVNVVHARGFVQ